MRVMGPAVMAIVVDALGFGLVYPLMTELFAGEEGLHMAAGMSLGMRHFWLGLTFLLYPLFSFFGAPMMGDLSEKYGRKKILMLCMAGQMVSFVLMGVGVEFVNMVVLLVGRALSGLMAGSQSIAQAVVVDRPVKQARNVAIITVVISAGIVIGPLMGGLFSDEKLVSWFTLSTPFYIAGALALIATVWIGQAFSGRGEKTEEKHVSWTRPLQVFWEGFANKDVRSLAIIFACMQIGFSLFYQLIQVFVSVVYDYPSWKIGVFNGFMGISFALVVLFGVRWMLQRLTIEKLATSSLLLTGIFLILPMIFPSQGFVWLMAFLAAGFNMMAYGALMVCFSNSVEPSKQGWVMGVFGAIMAATWALTGFSTNLISLIGLRWLIILGGCFMLLSFCLMAHRNAQASKN